MRRVLYGGAMSLDGFIAGPNGEHDWIVMDPDIDFAEMMAQYDTFLIGRKTFEVMRRLSSEAPPTPGITSIVCSRTLRPSDAPDVTVSPDAASVVTDLRTRPGKDIALFGGGELFRSLAGGRARRRRRRLGDPGLARGRCAVPSVASGPVDSEADEAPRLREDRHRRPVVRHRTLADADGAVTSA
jgi:dihydrofolate reductase